MKIALVQIEPDFGEIEKNVKRTLSLMEPCEADLYVLPELFSTGYAFKNRAEAADYAEKFADGQTFGAIRNFAKSHNSAIIYGYAERDSENIYNSCAFVDFSGQKENYRKIHLFYNEKNIFDPGNLGFKVVDYKNHRLGMMICFDWRFPEAARCLALMGAQIICHPANLVMQYCQDAMITRSLENHIYTVTANRIGTENRGGFNFSFTGKSQITDFDGNILYRASENKEEVYIADINIGEAKNKNINGLNDLFKDRRVEYYKRLGER